MNHPLLFRGLAACFFLAVFSASAATRTWNGSASAYWTNLANWQGGVLPGSGDDVVFPDSATRKTVTNTMDTPALHSVTFSGSNYVLQGAGGVYLVITNRLQSQAPGTNSVRHRMFLINNTTIENSLAGSVFDLKSHLPAGSSTNMINIASDNTFTGAGDIVLTHMRLAASQSQSLIKSGSGTLFFSGTASDWTGGFYVNGGRLELQSGLLDPGNVIVSSNGVFAGNGSVFTAYLHATGVIEPGRGSGLNVNNEFIFDQDSIMRIPFGMNSSPTAGKVDLNGQTSASDMRVGLELFATERDRKSVV